MTTPYAVPPKPGPLLKMLAGLRRANRLTQQDVATAMGTSQSAVSDLESGNAEPRLSTLARYAKACGVELRVTVQATVDLSAAYPDDGEDAA